MGPNVDKLIEVKTFIQKNAARHDREETFTFPFNILPVTDGYIAFMNDDTLFYSNTILREQI